MATSVPEAFSKTPKNTSCLMNLYTLEDWAFCIQPSEYTSTPGRLIGGCFQFLVQLDSRFGEFQAVKRNQSKRFLGSVLKMIGLYWPTKWSNQKKHQLLETLWIFSHSYRVYSSSCLSRRNAQQSFGRWKQRSKYTTRCRNMRCLVDTCCYVLVVLCAEIMRNCGFKTVLFWYWDTIRSWVMSIW